ncbi:hypothetical protein FHR22_001341 [Sphingopyxis panaciterrae]|uniref:hypothetical protein n=1 Tax=Sphingopyxis panaciterrae TaxID=363841 RepID=UPI0014245D4F|nr:hypothetical protein [Sphingopyxis panaciterrae]NIJ36692.1 hypothetical protein [Sphingopyxis panaciterrae]
MTRKPLVAVLTSVLLLPASCACGITANRMQQARQGMDVEMGGPLWLENLLWLGALALMLFWARRINRLYDISAGEPAPKETVE